MRWVGSRARSGALLALFALALQLIVSFGHVHAERLALPAADASIHVTLPDTDGAPAKPDGVPDDFCAICALIHLAGSLLPSAAPSLPAPILFSRPPLDLAVASALTASPHASFHARAPPLA